MSKAPRRTRASVTFTLAPETLAYLDAYGLARRLGRSAALDAVVASHAAAVRDRTPAVAPDILDLLARLLREVGANPGLDPARRLAALVAVGRVVSPGAAAALDRAAGALDALDDAGRVALLEAVEARAGGGTA